MPAHMINQRIGAPPSVVAPPTSANRTNPTGLAAQPSEDAEPPGTACSAAEVVVQVLTADLSTPYEFSHIGWEIDGVLLPPPDECSPDLCGAGGTAANCGCLYGRNGTYSHTFCLSPCARPRTVARP